MTTRSRTGQLDADGALAGFFRDPDWMFKTGIGGMIVAGCIILLAINTILMPIALALSSLVCGYLLKVMRYKTLNPSSKLPDWDEWMELFVSGLTWLAVQFGLALILISALTISLLIAAALGTIKITSGGFIAWALSTVAVMSFLCAALSFLTPLLMLNFAVEERVAAGFAFRKVVRKALRNPREFLVTWLLSIGVAWASVVLPTLTLIGIFFIPSTSFVGQVICATLWCQVWGQDK